MAFSEDRFRRQVETCLQTLKRVLEVERQPRPFMESSHRYDDKFAMAESMTNMALAAEVTILEALGVTLPLLQEMFRWAEERSVTLRFRATEVCP
jgi:hypothetical protein